MTKQSYKIIICKKKYLYLSSPEPFLTKITAPALAKYGGSPAPSSETLSLTMTFCPFHNFFVHCYISILSFFFVFNVSCQFRWSTTTMSCQPDTLSTFNLTRLTWPRSAWRIPERRKSWDRRLRPVSRKDTRPARASGSSRSSDSKSYTLSYIN